MECLNTENNKQNIVRKKSRTVGQKPDSLTSAAASSQQLKRPVDPTQTNKENAKAEEEEEDSYDFNPVCENCAG